MRSPFCDCRFYIYILDSHFSQWALELNPGQNLSTSVVQGLPIFTRLVSFLGFMRMLFPFLTLIIWLERSRFTHFGFPLQPMSPSAHSSTNIPHRAAHRHMWTLFISLNRRGGGGTYCFWCGSRWRQHLVSSCLHSIYWNNGWILTKLAQIHYWDGEKKWLDFGDLGLISILKFWPKKLVCTLSLEPNDGFWLTSYIITLG